jgi:hypothetical protein
MAPEDELSITECQLMILITSKRQEVTAVFEISNSGRATKLLLSFTVLIFGHVFFCVFFFCMKFLR